jgi:hypothetical protein
MMPQEIDFCPACKSPDIIWHSFLRDTFLCLSCGNIFVWVKSKTDKNWIPTGQIGGQELEWVRKKNKNV